MLWYGLFKYPSPNKFAPQIRRKSETNVTKQSPAATRRHFFHHHPGAADVENAPRFVECVFGLEDGRFIHVPIERVNDRIAPVSPYFRLIIPVIVVKYHDGPVVEQLPYVFPVRGDRFDRVPAVDEDKISGDSYSP